jgi:flavin-dependent dehydrogenase
MSSADRDVDVVIVGGGPAGAMSATLLARAGHQVLLVDNSRAVDFKIGESLPPEARPWLQQLSIETSATTPEMTPCYGVVSLWGAPEPHYSDFIANVYGHGWHVDRSRFDARLRDAAREAGAVLQLETHARIVQQSQHDGWQIALTGASTSEVRSRWLIDCSGRASPVMRQLGVQRHHDDRLIAVYAVLEAGDHDRDALTTVEAASEGWWYSAQLPDTRRVTVYLTDGDLPTSRQVRTTEGFLTLLATTRRLSTYCDDEPRLISTPRAAAANSSRLVQLCGPGWIAAGDAAIAFDPLSSYGIVVALRTAVWAATHVAHGLANLPLPDDQYAASVSRLYTHYLSERRRHYRAERRWSESTFWRRQSQLPSSGHATLAADPWLQA